MKALRTLVLLTLLLPLTATAATDAEAREGTLGFGLGWTFGYKSPTFASNGLLPGGATQVGSGSTYYTYDIDAAGILSPDFSGLRFRVDDRLVLEGNLDVSVGETDMDYLQDGASTSLDQRVLQVGAAIGLGARRVLLRRGTFDLELLGAMSAGYHRMDWEGNYARYTERGNSILEGSIDWGLGGSWYVRPNVSLSASAWNDLVSFSRTAANYGSTSGTDGDGNSVSYDEQVQYRFEGGLRFSPRFSVMAHLWF